MYALVHTTNHAYTEGRAVDTEVVKVESYRRYLAFRGGYVYSLWLANGQLWSVPAEHCVLYWN